MSNETHSPKPVMKKKKPTYAKQSYTVTLLKGTSIAISCIVVIYNAASIS